jgi:hypothetical protein
MDYQKVIEAIASAFKTTATELSAKLKIEGGEDFAPDAQAKLAAFISEKIGAVRADADGKATRRAWGQVSNVLKRNGFENPDGKEFDELVAAGIEHFQATATAGEPATMKIEDLKKLPTVKELLRVEKSALETLNGQLKASLEAEKKNAARALISGKIAAEQGRLIELHKVDLGEGDARAKKLKTLPRLLDMDRVGEADGVLVMIGDDGQPETDGMGGKITFEAHFKEQVIPVFGTVERRPGMGGAKPKTGGASGGGTAEIEFASQADFEAYMKDGTKTKQEKFDAEAAWYSKK